MRRGEIELVEGMKLIMQAMMEGEEVCGMGGGGFLTWAEGVDGFDCSEEVNQERLSFLPHPNGNVK